VAGTYCNHGPVSVWKRLLADCSPQEVITLQASCCVLSAAGQTMPLWDASSSSDAGLTGSPITDGIREGQFSDHVAD